MNLSWKCSSIIASTMAIALLTSGGSAASASERTPIRLPSISPEASDEAIRERLQSLVGTQSAREIEVIESGRVPASSLVGEDGHTLAAVILGPPNATLWMYLHLPPE